MGHGRAVGDLLLARGLGHDARRVELTLTPAGIALLKRAPEVLQVRLANAIGTLSPSHRRSLANGLEHLVGELGVGDAPPAMFFEAVG